MTRRDPPLPTGAAVAAPAHVRARGPSPVPRNEGSETHAVTAVVCESSRNCATSRGIDSNHEAAQSISRARRCQRRGARGRGGQGCRVARHGRRPRDGGASLGRRARDSIVHPETPAPPRGPGLGALCASSSSPTATSLGTARWVSPSIAPPRRDPDPPGLRARGAADERPRMHPEPASDRRWRENDGGCPTR